MATNATTDTFESEVSKSGGKVIVDFWAEWCGPCHAVSAVLDRIADEHQVKIVKVNIDEQQDLAQRFGVASIPFMVLFEDGQPQARRSAPCRRARSRRLWGWRRPPSRAYADASRLRRGTKEGEVLGEVALDRVHALAGQVLDPGVGEIVLDQVQGAAQVHPRMIDVGRTAT